MGSVSGADLFWKMRNFILDTHQSIEKAWKLTVGWEGWLHVGLALSFKHFHPKREGYVYKTKDMADLVFNNRGLVVELKCESQRMTSDDFTVEVLKDMAKQMLGDSKYARVKDSVK